MSLNEELMKRIRSRIPEEEAGNEILGEYASTVSDRICLRLGADNLPDPFQSICVDAVVKMHRRMYYEGISSESVANLSTAFVDDILAEYETEISRWRERQANSAGTERLVRFL